MGPMDDEVVGDETFVLDDDDFGFDKGFDVFGLLGGAGVSSSLEESNVRFKKA